MGEEELKVGLMTKRAQQKKSIGPTNYKDRVFVLTPTKLSYYEGNTQHRGKIKGSISLRDVTFVGNISDNNLQSSNSFQIYYKDCFLYCCPKTEMERDEWIIAVKQACLNLGNTMQLQYHKKIFSSGKWQCCLKTDRQAKGCTIAEDDRFKKSLPNLPLPLGLNGPPLPLPPVSSRRNTFGNSLPQASHNPPNLPMPNMSIYPRMTSPSNYPDVTPRSNAQRQPIPNLPPMVPQPRPPSQFQMTQTLPSPGVPYPTRSLVPSAMTGGPSGWRGDKTNSGEHSRNIQSNHHHPSNTNYPMVTLPNPKNPRPASNMHGNHNYHDSRSDIEAKVMSYGSGSNYMPSHSTSAHLQSVAQSQAQAPLPPPPDLGPKLVTAIYDFQPQEPEDISLVVGQVYTVLDTSRAHWWRVRDASGQEGYIPANYVKERTGDGLEMQPWFQKELTRQKAEFLLKQDGKEGSFVIRNSSQQNVIYTLSVVSKAGMINGPSRVRHYHIRQTEQNQYFLAEKHPQPTIMALINYHKHNAAGLVTRLRQAPQNFLDTHQPVTHLFSDSKWEIDINELTFDRELGSGQFGVVRFGKYRGKIDVALKIMKEGTMEEDQFIEEAEVMTKLQHHHLVELYGVVTKQRPICIVTEFMEGGCLLDYIRKNQNLQNHPDVLLDFSNQVCDAMKYLESIKTIHRDLAARNCLVGKENIIKVADFGLSRYVLDDEYTSSLGSKFPIKWAAPEVLNYTKFSSKSDVWAFGVLMWELFTGGKTPYRALSNNEVVEKVAHGHRLERPPNCPHSVYRIMQQTWEMEPEKRPSFEHLFEIFPDLIDEITASCMPEGMYDAN